METKIASTKGLIKPLIYEFFGSMILTLGYFFTSYTSAYFVLWMICVNVSGAHFNPAISFAVYLTERKFK